MSKRSRRRNSSKNHSRKRRGGANAPLASGPYPSGGSGQWSATVNGNAMAAGANNFKTLLGNVGAESGGPGQNPALASKMLSDFALRGNGQSGGGSKRRRRSPRRRQAQSQSQGQAQSQSQGQAQSQSQSGGMFATFGALLQEALVPLGLLAAQQSYGRKYDSKRRTKKNK